MSRYYHYLSLYNPFPKVLHPSLDLPAPLFLFVLINIFVLIGLTSFCIPSNHNIKILFLPCAALHPFLFNFPFPSSIVHLFSSRCMAPLLLSDVAFLLLLLIFSFFLTLLSFSSCLFYVLKFF